MADSSTKLDVRSRAPEGSRAARRLRRSGRVPGVLYGGGGDAVGWDVEVDFDLLFKREDADAEG